MAAFMFRKAPKKPVPFGCLLSFSRAKSLCRSVGGVRAAAPAHLAAQAPIPDLSHLDEREVRSCDHLRARALYAIA